MAKYYVNMNPQSDSGDHEVHEKGCSWLPLIADKKYLGEFPSCHGAVAAAKKIYPTADGCEKCSPKCHKF